MLVAGFDIATVTGCAVLDGTRVVHIEAFRAPGKTDPEIFARWRPWFRNMILAHGIEYIAVEAPLVTDIQAPDRRENAQPGQKRNPVTMKTYLRLYGLRAHAVEIAHTLNVGCIEIHQSTWRKAFTGNGRATKEQVLVVARQLVPNLKSKDASDALGVAWALNGELNHRASDMFAAKEVA